ncbi:TPA: ATP-dependent DNA helicase PcrA, partial [Candidatus Beckwithbacteria bacterium]|nr:ATP-dependent DNA helicase PcrA [Candidatus Beckwithbacteria bacterium]
KLAVTFGEGPLLILAGAGSGKTRALTYRVAYLIKERQVDPKRILLVTFTNKAAGEMRQRLEKLVGRDHSAGLFAGTFHAFCVRLLRIDGGKIGIEPNFVIYDEADSLAVIKKAIKNLKLNPKTYKPRGVKSLISQAKNELISAEAYPQYARGEWQKGVAEIFLEYQRLLNRFRALDFDDLLMKAVYLLKKDQPTRQKYQDRYQWVLVDEYQDTNKAQYELTKILAGKWRNLAAVGDFSQSIYAFRGADYRNINQLKQDFADLRQISLEQNYRSTQTILDAATAVIAKNSLHPVLTLWTKAGLGAKVKIFEADNEKEEAGFIVATIKNDPGSHAVLYRTNAQSRVIEEALLKNGMAYSLVGGVRFYARREIKDLTAYLRLINNPKDLVSYQRLEKLGKRSLNRFVNWLDQKKNIDKLPTRKILEQVVKVTGYLDRFDKKNEEDLNRLENIDELNSVAEEFKDLGAFLENAALVEAADRPTLKGKENHEGVTLMTMHNSKGLEFDTVFMIGMEEGLFPHSRSSFNKEDLEEERRLCYVGMTRAKRQLYLSYARGRFYFGRRNYNTVSRFLADIDEGLLEFVNQEFDIIT